VQEYPDLVEVVKAWADLPEDTRTAIKALIIPDTWFRNDKKRMSMD
jgi:hypothetical protein